MHIVVSAGSGHSESPPGREVDESDTDARLPSEIVGGGSPCAPRNSGLATISRDAVRAAGGDDARIVEIVALGAENSFTSLINKVVCTDVEPLTIDAPVQAA
ncbi:hypothetical protein GCM10007301_52330 [Azorhizobium oxalatiphilum]|uniref:Uncharacterized protein n=1 Tax=Azorhizobium oxalatiphilum TaxID=980631 RepID=A0A917CGV0_9HYPH|nr:hypothetical protein [Azorhizobium oxalatiphilum]GGF85999.1 hypothetical protein GCM10007301_52330 [Azorhizobium oxalatiphilum]